MVEECSQAAKKSDARDKHFLSHVAGFEALPAKALLSELPSLEAAKSSLAAATAELADVIPQLDLCHAASLANGGASTQGGVSPGATFTTSRRASGAAASLIDEEIGVDVVGLDLLLKEARASILSLRRALV